MSSSSSQQSVKRLRDFLRVLNRIEQQRSRGGSGGFGTALGMHHPTHFFGALSSSSSSSSSSWNNNNSNKIYENVQFDESSKTLKVRLPVITRNRLLPSYSQSRRGEEAQQQTQNENKDGRNSNNRNSSNHLVSLSTYLAMIDDITSWAGYLSSPKHGRMGVSVNLQTQWVTNPNNNHGGSSSSSNNTNNHIGRRVGDQVDVIATVKKVGRNLEFIEAQIRDTTTQQVICIGSHIKYLPMGPVVDFLQSAQGFPLLQWYTDTVDRFGGSSRSRNDENDIDDVRLDTLFDSLQFTPFLSSSSSSSQNGNQHEQNEPVVAATFQRSPSHASLGGPIHGGCQAVLMELVATEYLQKQLLQRKQTTTASASMPSNNINNNNTTQQQQLQLQLHSMSVDYLSPPVAKSIDILVQPLVQIAPPQHQWHPGTLIPLKVMLRSSSDDGGGDKKNDTTSNNKNKNKRHVVYSDALLHFEIIATSDDASSSSSPPSQPEPYNNNRKKNITLQSRL